MSDTQEKTQRRNANAKGKRNDNQKERGNNYKPRREGDGKRKDWHPPKPSPKEEAIQKRIEALTAQYETLRAEQAEIRKIISVKTSARNSQEKDASTAAGRVAIITKRIDKAKEDLKNNEELLHQAEKARELRMNEVKKFRNKIEFKFTRDSVKDNQYIDAQIKDLETQQQTQSLDLRQEKELVARIQKWKATRQALRDYETMLAEAKKATGTRQYEVRVQRSKENIAKLEEELAVERAAAERETEKVKSDTEVPALEKKINDVQQRVNQVLVDITEAKKDLEAARNEALEQHRAKQEEDAKRRQLLREKHAEEQKKYQLEKQQRELENVPFMDEQADCHEIITYLQGLLGQSSPAPAAAAAAATATPAVKPNEALVAPSLRKVDPINDPKLVPLKRDDEVEQFVAPKPKPAKPKAKTAKAKPKAAPTTITHNVLTLHHFAKIGVEPPIRFTDVAKTLASVKEKLAEFESKSKVLQEQRLKEFQERQNVSKDASNDASNDAKPSATTPVETPVETQQEKPEKTEEKSPEAPAQEAEKTEEKSEQ